MADKARAHVLVEGEVQGVFFRQSTVDAARRLGLAGWVRNTPAGLVEIEAEGERSQVEELVAWCRHGPPSARVDDVRVSWSAFSAALGPFAIRR